MARKKELIPGFVSVLIPTFERPNFFEKTLKSALNQTYSNYEIIIADASRTEDTQILMHKFSGIERITYLHDVTATKTETFAIFEEIAKGEFIQWLPDDDIILPKKLEYMTRCFKQEKKVKLVTSRRDVIDESGKNIGQLGTEIDVDGLYGVLKGRDIGNFTLEDFKNPFGGLSAPLFRWRDLTHHYFRAKPKGYRVIGDIAMWLELMEGGGECAVFKEPLSLSRKHKKQFSAQKDNILRSRIEWFMLGTDYYLRRIFLTQWKEYVNLLLRLLTDYEKNILPSKSDYEEEPHFEAYNVAINEIKEILEHKRRLK